MRFRPALAPTAVFLSLALAGFAPAQASGTLDAVDGSLLPRSDPPPAAAPFRTAAPVPDLAPRVTEGAFAPPVRYCRDPDTGGWRAMPAPPPEAAGNATPSCFAPMLEPSLRERVMRGW